MTVELFIYLFVLGSGMSSLITQAAKKGFPNLSSNILALIDAIIVGVIGTLCAYLFLGMAFDAKNIVSAILMGVCIWIGSMCGYDKVIQTLRQLGKG